MGVQRIDIAFVHDTDPFMMPGFWRDNFEKALYDLLQRKGYLLDDKWITSARWRKRFLPFGTEGYTEVTIRREQDDIELTK